MSESIGGILERALDAQGLRARIERRLPAQVWREAVGDEIAARAQPTFLSAGVLHVLVLDGRWRDQLDAARGLLLARLNARLGKHLVKSLQFGLAHGGILEAARAAQATARSWAPLDAAQLAQVGRHVPGSEHLPDGLREALLGATAAARRRALGASA